MKNTTETRIQQRFGDIDQMGHVNNARQMEYLDTGKADFSRRVMMHEAQVENITPIIAAIKVDFLAQLLYNQDVWVRTWVERIGHKSITLRQQIFVRHYEINSSSEPAVDKTQCSPPRGAASDCEFQRNSSQAIAETICTESQTVMVAYDRSTGESVEFPQAWRERVGQ